MTQQQWFKPDLRHKGNQRIAYINARLIDPATGLDQTGDLITEGNVITDFGSSLIGDTKPDNIQIIDCGGHILCPGLIDLQVHFREPGQEHKETIKSGSKSAAAGGLTSVVCMPNTKPAIDDPAIVDFIHTRAKETSYINIHVYGSITRGQKGTDLSEMGLLKDAGVVGFTDDGHPVMNAQVMRRALEYSSILDLPVAQHAEDMSLAAGGCMNEGKTATRLGLRGIPNIAESIMIERDIALLELTGGHYHALHISAKESVEVIRRAKEKGLNVTCEVTPHHLSLTEEDIGQYRTFAKMNPPLRTETDVDALKEGLKDGTIDAIATDHAPHDRESKRVTMDAAAFGIVGVETMLPLLLELVHNGTLTLSQALAKVTCNAADIIRQPSGRLVKGARADLTLIDPNMNWTIDTDQFSSKSHNSPFDGRHVKGRAIRTIVAGQTVYKLG